MLDLQTHTHIYYCIDIVHVHVHVRRYYLKERQFHGTLVQDEEADVS